MILFAPSKVETTPRSAVDNDEDDDDSQYDTPTLPSTHQHSNSKKRNNKHFRQLSLDQMNGATYSWTISDPSMIEQMAHAHNKQKFASTSFNVGNLQFRLELFPNGFDQKSQGVCDLFLKLLKMPSEWTEVWVNYRLYCHETLASWTFIQRFKKGGFWGWHDGCMFHREFRLVHDDTLNRTTQFNNEVSQSSLTKDTEEDSHNNNHHNDHHNDQNITFSSFIQILRANSNKNDVNAIIYEKHLSCSDQYHFQLEWNVSDELFNVFKICKPGKYYESDIFYEMWNLRVAPNGTNIEKSSFLDDDGQYSENNHDNQNNGQRQLNGGPQDNNSGNLTLFLNLCCLPPNISKIRVRYTLSCLESKTKWKYMRDFSYSASLSGWPNEKIKTKDLRDYESLTFTADVYIVQMYDFKGQLVEIDHKNGDGQENLDEIKEDEPLEREHPSVRDNMSFTQDYTETGTYFDMGKSSIIDRDNTLAIDEQLIIDTEQLTSMIYNINNKFSDYERKMDQLTTVMSTMQQQMNMLSDDVNDMKSIMSTFKEEQLERDELEREKHDGFQQTILTLLLEMRNSMHVQDSLNTTPMPNGNGVNKNNYNNVPRFESSTTRSQPYPMRNSNQSTPEHHQSASHPVVARGGGKVGARNRGRSLHRHEREHQQNNYSDYSKQQPNPHYQSKSPQKYRSNKHQSGKPKVVRWNPAHNNTSSQSARTPNVASGKHKHKHSQRELLRSWFTKQVKLPQYFDLFVEAGIEDIAVIVDMTINELKLIGIKSVKDQLRIQQEITTLRNAMIQRQESQSMFDTV